MFSQNFGTYYLIHILYVPSALTCSFLPSPVSGSSVEDNISESVVQPGPSPKKTLAVCNNSKRDVYSLED